MLLPPHVLLTMPIGTPVDFRSSRAKKYATALKAPAWLESAARPAAADEIVLRLLATTSWGS